MAKKKEPGENMKKKKKKKQKMKELNQIGNFPKFNKLPTNVAPNVKRSPSSSYSPSSLSASGFLPQVSYDRDEASGVTLTSFDDKNDGRKKLHDSVDCSKSCDERSGFVLNFSSVEVESVAVIKVSEPCSGRLFHKKVVEQKSDKKKLKARGSNGVCITPGNVVWAKTDRQVWWPAEIIGDRSILADSKTQNTEEGILVKFYGKNKSGWVDAARDLSLFEDCFEERSSNPVENFQDALKQALVQRKEHLKSCRKLPGSCNFSNHSDKQDKKSGKSTSSTTSSKTGSNLVKAGGIKKEGQPTMLPDDATSPSKSAKGSRRLKIMRHLGLTAPRGSPF